MSTQLDIDDVVWLSQSPLAQREVTARLRKAEGWKDNRFSTPVIHDCGEERTECECREPQDNDQRVCMACGCWIAYGSRA